MLPRSLLGRSLLILVTPLVLLQLVAALVFFENHWSNISRRLSHALAAEVAVISNALESQPEKTALTPETRAMAQKLGFYADFLGGVILPNRPPDTNYDQNEKLLANYLAQQVKRPVLLNTWSYERELLILVQHSQGVLKLTTTRKRVTSITTTLFILWMTGSSLLLFGVATLFMRNQVRPIRRLAAAAEAFGKGRDVSRFKPEGASEVRQAASAFIEMRDRIVHHIGERTSMLAGVSHDLRTPLTRMRLALALMGKTPGAEEVEEDIDEMTGMLDGYLAFARGEGGELPVIVNLGKLLGEVADKARRNGANIDLHVEGTISLAVKPEALGRCLTNLVDNAQRFAENISLRAGTRGKSVEIFIDDDGPGIPEQEWNNVFRPFVRLERSRNQATGGVGLGLSIARDVARGHGGEITLGRSPLGGLRVRLRLPL